MAAILDSTIFYVESIMSAMLDYGGHFGIKVIAAILDSTTFYVETIISAILDLGRDAILDYDVIVNYVMTAILDCDVIINYVSHFEF